MILTKLHIPNAEHYHLDVTYCGLSVPKARLAGQDPSGNLYELEPHCCKRCLRGYHKEKQSDRDRRSRDLMGRVLGQDA